MSDGGHEDELDAIAARIDQAEAGDDEGLLETSMEALRSLLSDDLALAGDDTALAVDATLTGAEPTTANAPEVADDPPAPDPDPVTEPAATETEVADDPPAPDPDPVTEPAAAEATLADAPTLFDKPASTESAAVAEPAAAEATLADAPTLFDEPASTESAAAAEPPAPDEPTLVAEPTSAERDTDVDDLDADLPPFLVGWEHSSTGETERIAADSGPPRGPEARDGIDAQHATTDEDPRAAADVPPRVTEADDDELPPFVTAEPTANPTDEADAVIVPVGAARLVPVHATTETDIPIDPGLLAETSAEPQVIDHHTGEPQLTEPAVVHEPVAYEPAVEQPAVPTGPVPAIDGAPPTSAVAAAPATDGRSRPPSPWLPRVTIFAALTLLIAGSVVLWMELLGEPPDSIISNGDEPAPTAEPSTAGDIEFDLTPQPVLEGPSVDGAVVSVTDERLAAMITRCDDRGMEGQISTTDGSWTRATIRARFESDRGELLMQSNPVEELAPPSEPATFSFGYDASLVPEALQDVRPRCAVIISASPVDGG